MNDRYESMTIAELALALMAVDAKIQKLAANPKIVGNKFRVRVRPLKLERQHISGLLKAARTA